MKPRSVMIYGASGMTKTTQLYHMAKYIIKTTGKKIRMIHSDPGGYAPFQDSGLVEQRLVDVFDYSAREHALSDFRWLSDGYWPRWVKDGNVYADRIPESTELFVKEPVCKTTPEEWANIGAVFIDSITSTADTMKNHISNQKEGVGFKESWRYEEEGETLIGLQMGHYGMIQKEISDRHRKGFNNLPVQWLIYTGLNGKGDDKDTKETVCCPQLVGTAGNASVPSWFMDCLHMTKEKYNDKAGNPKEGIVAWFVNHPDTETGMPCRAKARIMPELYEKLIGIFPYGFVPIGYTNGVDLYFRVLERLRSENGKTTG